MDTWRNDGQVSRKLLPGRLWLVGGLALLLAGAGCTDLWGNLQGSGAGGGSSTSATSSGGGMGGGGSGGADGGVGQPSATDIVSVGQVSTNPQFTMVSTVGQVTPTQNDGLSSAQNAAGTEGFILRGGLIGATGSQP